MWVSGDRVPWGKMMGFTKAAEKWKTGMLIQAYERVELTGLWVHGVVERKEARVKLRILTGPEDAGGAAAGRENTGRGVGLGAEAGAIGRWPLGHSVVLGRVCRCSSGGQGCPLMGDTG